MTNNGVRYEHKTVKAVRGTESRSIAKWEKHGWELIGQDTATLHTMLSFRKVKPELPMKQLVVAGAVLAGLLGIAGLASALSGGDDDRPTGTSTPTPTAAAAPEPTEEPAPTRTTPTPPAPASAASSPAELADGPVTDTTVDELLDRLNAPSSSGIKVGDRFRFTGELFEEDAWGVGVTGEYSVFVKAKDGADDLFFFVDRALTTGWRNGTRVEVVVRVEERTIDGETSDGWLRAETVRTL